MAVTTATTVDVAQVLSAALADVDGVRVDWYVSDKSRPPVAVIGLPSIDWQDPESGFCWATWEFPVTIVTARNSDRDAQTELSRLVRDIANALNDYDTAGTGVAFIATLDARPTAATISGQELPAYQMRVQVRA